MLPLHVNERCQSSIAVHQMTFLQELQAHHNWDMLCCLVLLDTLCSPPEASHFLPLKLSSHGVHAEPIVFEKH